MLRVIYKDKEYNGGFLYSAIIVICLGLYSLGVEYPEYNPLDYIKGDCEAQ